MKEKIELKKFVDEILLQLLPAAAAYKCKLENYISPGVILVTDTEAFIFIFYRLLKLIIQSSYHSSIRISNLYEGDSLSIIIKDNNNDYRGFISGKMEKHQAIIRKAGGCLRFEFIEKKSITVVLSFINQKTDQVKD